MKTTLLAFLCLLCWQTCLTQTPRIVYNPSKKSFKLEDISRPIKAAGAKNTPFWDYFWEFGDGHFSTAKEPTYCYSDPGTYPVQVSLTPHYSYEASRVYNKTINARNNCNTNRKYNNRGLINIDSDAANELIPNSKIQLALHYKMPNTSTTEGYLFLLYNAKVEREKFGFSPLKFNPSTPPRVHGSKTLDNPKNLSVLPDMRTDAQKYLSDLMREKQYAVLGFKSAPILQEGASRRVFVTLEASASLDSTLIRKKRGKLKAQIRAVWIPKNTAFDPSSMVINYDLVIASVHDPNRIRVLEPTYTAVYKRNRSERFVYEIEFQNKGGRAVKGVELAIPWNQNLDYSSIKIIERSPKNDEVCRDCGDNFPPPEDGPSCFRVDTSKVLNTGIVYFYFYNTMIHGKRERGVGGGRDTKGSVTFSVNSTNKKQGLTEKEVAITFLGGETFTTRKAKMNWRHKGFGLKVGRNLPTDIGLFMGTTDSLNQWINIGLYYRNSYLRNGFTPLAGGELTYSGVGFEAEIVEPIFVLGDGGDFLSQLELIRENISLQTLDFQLQSEARIGGFIGIGIGAGLSVPLKGRGDIGVKVFDFGDLRGSEYAGFFQEYEEISDRIFDEMYNLDSGFAGNTTSTFGLLDDREITNIFNEEIVSNFNIGYMFSWFVEAGALNNVALGLRHNFRYYPNTYKEQCLKYNHFEVYARLKLNSMK